MRLHNILCLGLLFVLAGEGSFAQCGHATQQPAFFIAPNVLPTPRTVKRDPEDRKIDLRLEMTDKGSVRGVEVLGDPGKLRKAAILAAVKFANTKKYIDRTTWPVINVFVWFPQKGHRAPLVVQVVPGALGCVSMPLRVRVSSSVMGCLLLDRIEPIYPAETQNIKDQLTLAVLVGKDGNVLNVRKISGPENLAPAAVEAVTKWKYRPYLLNGEPIEVDTTVDLPIVNLPAGGCSAVLPVPYLLIRPMPSWLFNTKPIIPVLATQGAAK